MSKPKKNKHVNIKLNDKQVARFRALFAGVEKAELVFNTSRAQLDLYIASIRDSAAIDEKLTSVKVEDDKSITFTAPK